jgi:PAS domain S-box-containing protein
MGAGSVSGDIDLLVGRWSADFADQGILTTDSRLVITSWNRWLERHSPHTAADVVGRPLFDVFPELRTRGLDQHYHDALAGRAYFASHLLHGHWVPLRPRGGACARPPMRQSARVAPLSTDGGATGTITIIDDVSERVAAEQELRRQIEAQEKARVAAEQAARVKDDILALMGHELRNPLAPILTALQLLKLRGVESVERERTIIERQVRRLVTLVNDLLDVSRIFRGRLELRCEPVQLADVVADALEEASPLLEQRRHELRVNVPRTGLLVNGDAHRLAQAVTHLLTNAAKYTQPGGRIDVVGRTLDEDVLLQVRDTGAGMDDAMLARAFEPFAQEAQASDRPRGGLGLGLTIVRSLIDLHGGSVSAASEGPSTGCEFTIRLPRLAAADPAAPATAQAHRTSRRTRVLVVDDNRDAADLLAEMLDAIGYDATFAVDGPSALRTAEEFDPDVAVLDIGLPVMDGYELASRFASHPRLSRTRLVALTGYGQPNDRDRAAEAGFHAHLLKPVNVDQLHSVLESLLGEIAGRNHDGRSGG